LIVERENAVEN